MHKFVRILDKYVVLRAFGTTLRVRRNLITYFIEQFSKLIFVRKIVLGRPCEESEI